MVKKLFKGGIHPPGYKNLSRDKKIEQIPLPQKVILLLSQHTGKPAIPVVNKGDYVKRGEIVARPDGYFSLPVHASISGKVTKIDYCPHPNGGRSLAIFVDSQGQLEEIKYPQYDEYFRYHKEEIIKIIQEGGISGLGGASFPTHIKLDIKDNVFIDTLIINGCECEPFLTTDERLMIEFPEEIIEGAKIAASIVQADKIIIAVEDNKPQAISALKEVIKYQPNMNLKVLPAFYPQGSEKQLIKALIKREVPSGGLPLDVGVVVNNVGTVYAIRELLKKGKPLIERVITVSGPGIKNPKNLLVPLGITFQEVIDYCGGIEYEEAKVIMGGPLTGVAQYCLDVPVTKGVSGILVLPPDKEIDKEGVCIRCGKCVNSCPMGLMPNFIADYAKAKKWDMVKKYNVLDCIECGICAYVCPENRNVIQYIKYAKNEIGNKK